MSRRSSSRKEDLVLKVNKKEVLEINSDDDDDKDDDDKTEGDDAEVVSLSDASSDEVIAPKKQRNVSYNKAAFSMPDDISKLMNRVLCTACGKQLNPMNHGAIRKHPWLKVITCKRIMENQINIMEKSWKYHGILLKKKCYKFLKSGPFTRDEDGTDEQCRWCGDGGRLYGCDYCNNCFCRSCIKRNIGRTEAAEMESDEATKSKWKCYMCKPKKIKTLQENCNKILDYIKKEEDKEKEREERAKQREKEKAQAKKDKKKEADKKDKRNSLPLPIKPKNESNESREKTPNKTGGFPAPKPKDSIVIDDSPEKPANKLATAKSHLPGYQSRPGDGVTQVQKVGNGVTQVTVGPKAKLPVSMPYKDGIKLNNTQSQSFGRSSSLQSLLAPKPIQPLPLNRPNLLGALTNQFPSAPTNAVTVDKKGITQVAKNNDIRALKEQIVPFNVETITEKLSTVAQAFSLTLNHVKTDLAIAKISSSNLFNSRSSAAYSVKTGLDVFCNNLRDIFNVQIITSSPSSDEPITLDDDKKSVKGLPNGNDSSIDKDSAKGSDKKEIKEEIKQIKKEMKVETNGPIEESKDQVKSEKNDTEEKMEIDDGDSKENKNSDKDTKVHKKDKSENSGENNDEMETSDTEQNESEGDTRKDKDTSPTSKISNKSSRVESDKSENTAAELDILKELADEINEANEKEESMEEEMETRRSSRRKKSQGDNEEDEADKSSETEQTPKRSSSRRKLQSDEKESQDEKNQKSTKKASEKDKDKDDDADGSSETEQEQRRSSRRKPEEKEKSKDTKDSSDKKSKDKSKIDTKNSKSSTKSEESKEADKPSVNDIGDDNEVISSDSDSSVSSAEFGKRRTRRKQKEKDEDKAKSESKSKGSNSEKSKSKDKSEKSDKKDKEKTDKKESRSTRSKKSSEDKEEYHSDSSNFDADLEKDIKSLSKDTKLTRSSRRTGKDESDSTEKEDKAKGGKKTAGKGKLDKSKKEDSVEESENSQEKSDEEEEDDPTPETTGEKLTKVNDRKSKNKKDESDDDTDADEDADNESKEDEEEDEENEEVDEDDLSPAQLRKLRAAQKKDEESDYEDMVASDNSDSEDPEVSFPKLSTPKKGKNKGGKGKKDDEVTIESDDSDFVTPKKNKKRKLKSDLLDAKVSDSDSDVGAKKKKKGRGKKRKKEEEEDEEPDPEDEIYSDDEKKKKGKGKRKRIRKVASSSDEEKEKGEEGGDEGEDDDLEDTPGGAHKRKKIRKVMANKKLADSTKEARKVEEERRKRIEERQKEFNAYVEVEGGEEEEEVPEGTEREKKEGDDSIAKILGTAKKVPVTTKCVLDMEKEAKKVLVEIDKTLVRKLKPHQVEAVRFMYNCCVESVERMKKEEGAGCILAHCMGLGKTLSVISFLHTMLRNTKLTKTTKCLVVCPLNTVLNWVNEFEIWLDDVDYEIEVYEMSKVKQNYERAQMLREWHEGGAGVMILGYDMYRNLVNGSHCKNKKQKATFYETLADPGPDIVVCDEGHVLKNDQTSLSKAMMKIKTRRRVVLTGTPLQNNLGEYHCMVSFVKPNLLGTRKEFSNRFVNPITNGQCSDSTGSDVKLMKRRAHILHEMLAGCVQRKDYSALTKFLPPKFEYVVSVRMSPLQCTLYENYLKEAGIIQNEEVHNKGGRLFRDYQALMRIWTHPWVLKLDEIRQENKKPFDDSEDSFIDDETDDDGEDSFISGSTTSESDADFNPKSKKKKKSKGKKGKKKGSDSDSDSDVKEVGEENEVIKKWSSKRRGNEEGAGSSWMQDMGYATGPKEVSDEWWAQYVKEEDEFKIELSGKLSLMFEILRMCEDIGDKVLIFSQSLLSLDIIEDFLHFVDESNNKEEGEEGENKDNKDKKEEEAGGSGTSEGEKKEKTEEEKKKEEQKKEQEKKREKYAQYGKSWTVGADYFRMDGSTSSQQRKAAQDSFNDPENYRARLFLISTKAGSLGINLVAANRVIIFDASWNPSHDIQSIFRVYRFGQIKPVYVYRFLAQGTMEEKIYERQVTKQSLSQRVVDEHQIERHFSANDLQELYKFQPDKLDDPDRKERPLPMLPKDHMLAELMSTQKDWIVTFHEHDSLLENIIEQELSEEEKKAAWEDYENEKKGLNTAYPMYGNMMNAQQRMNSALEFQNLVLQGQANLGQEAVLQIVQDLKARFPTLPPEVFSQRVQAVLRQVLTQRIMQQSDFQRRQLDQQKMAELNRLNQIKQQIQQQQAMLNSQQRSMGVGGNYYNSLYGVQALPSSGFSNNLMARAMGFQNPPAAHSSQSASLAAQKSNTKGDKK